MTLLFYTILWNTEVVSEYRFIELLDKVPWNFKGNSIVPK